METSKNGELECLFIWPFAQQIPFLPHILAFGETINEDIKPNFIPKILIHKDEELDKGLNLSLHHDERNITCGVCGRGFKNYKGLKQHMGKLHSAMDKIHKCSLCDKKFKSKFGVKFHLEQVHEDKKKVKCLICYMVLYNKYAFEKHNHVVHSIGT